MTHQSAFIFFVSFLLSSSAFGQIYEGEDAKKIIPIAKTLQLNKQSPLPTFLVFEEAEQMAAPKFQDWEKKTFQYEAGLTFKIRKTVVGKNGMTHEFRDQFYHNIPIEHALSVIHYQDGKVIYINGDIHNQLSIGTTPFIQKEAAAQTALAKVGITTQEWQAVLEQRHSSATDAPHPQEHRMENTLVICPHDGKYFLTWKSHIISPQLSTYKYVYIDAQTGEVIDVQEASLSCHVGTAETSYRGEQTILTNQFGPNFVLHNDCFPANIRTRDPFWDFFDDDNDWDSDIPFERAARTAHFGVTGAFDYFNNTHGQIGLDGSGIVNVEIVEINNAYYQTGTLTIGFGTGANSLSADDDFTPPDACGHEFTHGMLYHSGGITNLSNYETEALHEGIADIFGVEVEAFIDNAAPEWSLGEEIDNFGSRLLNDPNSDVHFNGALGSPDTYMGNFWSGSLEHVDGGVMRYWFYLVSQGGSGVNDNNTGYQVTGVGHVAAAEILYDAISSGSFGSSPNYFTARNATLQSALNLFGYCSPEVLAVYDAWNAVGVQGPGIGTPDVSIAALQVTTAGAIPTGGSFSVSFNTGANSEVYSMSQTQVGFFIKPYCQTSGLTFANAVRVGQISCGSTTANTTNITLPSNIGAGQYYLIAKADYYNNLAEPNEINNTTCTLFEVIDNSQLPDFVPRWPIVSPSSVLPGDNISTNIYHFNHGNAYGDYTFLCYYLSTNTTYSSNDVYLGNSYMSGLSPSTSSSAANNLTIPTGTAPGNYYIIFRADCFSWRQELNENNNTTYLPITVTTTSGTPDLTIQNVNPSPSVGSPPFRLVGEYLNVQYDLVNLNLGTNPGPTTTRVYLSLDETLSSNDIPVLTSSGVSPGSRTALFQIPSGVQQSQYYRILLVADYYNSVTESNESNNIGIGHVLVLQSLGSVAGEDQAVLEGIGNDTRNNPPSVFPNPTRDQFTVSYPAQDAPISINLFNSTGQKVASHFISAAEQDGQWRYDASGLPSGVYYVQWQSKDKVELLNLVIE